MKKKKNRQLGKIKSTNFSRQIVKIRALPEKYIYNSLIDWTESIFLAIIGPALVITTLKLFAHWISCLLNFFSRKNPFCQLVKLHIFWLNVKVI